MKKYNGFTPILVLIIVLIVGGVGFLVFKTNPPSPFGSPKPSAEAATPDSISDWKTYENTKYEYSFKYPQGTTLQSTAAGIGIVSPNPDSSEISFGLQNTNQERVQVYAIDYFATLINPNQWDKTEVQINGESVEKYAYKQDKNQFLYRFKNQKTETQVDFTYKCSQCESKNSKLFDQILSTFQFTK